MSRLAICLRGDFREWDITRDLFFKTIDSLDFDEVDFFIATYNSIHNGYRDSELFRPNFLLPLDIEEIRKDFDKRNLISIVTVDDNTRFNTDVFNCIYHVNKEKRKYELENDFRYDAVLNTRTDVVLNTDIFTSEKNNKRLHEYYVWNKPVLQNRACQDVLFFGSSVEIDIISKIHIRKKKYHNVHIDLSRYLHSTYLSNFHDESGLRYIYRRDMLNCVPLDNEKNAAYMKVAADDWWSRKKVNSLSEFEKITYDKNRSDAEFNIKAFFPNLFSDDIQLTSDYIYNNSMTIFNKDLLNQFKEMYFSRQHNVIIRSLFSVIVTDAILTVSGISTYIDKVIYD